MLRFVSSLSKNTKEGVSTTDVDKEIPVKDSCRTIVVFVVITEGLDLSKFLHILGTCSCNGWLRTSLGVRLQGRAGS